MSTLRLKELKSIPNRTKCIAFGYIHAKEKQLSLPNVPDSINYLCLMYYFHGEFFEKAGNDLKICDERMSIQKVIRNVNQWNNTGYCKTWISSDLWHVIKWDFLIQSFGDPGKSICVGIASKDNRLNDDFASPEDKPYAYFAINPEREGIDSGDSPIPGQLVYLPVMKIYQLVFDTLNWRLHIKKDGKIITTMNIKHFPNDDTKYKLAVCMAGYNAKIKFCDFSIE